MDINFAGKTALITGAGKGIGRETARLLAKCGASVIALTRTQSDLDYLKEEIPNLQSICVDLLNLSEAIRAVETCGHIDLLVNNASFSTSKSCLDITQDDLQNPMLVCVTAPLLLTQVVAKKLIKAGKSGAVVNISTMGTNLGTPFTFPLVTVRSALESVTRCSAVELAPHKVRVNCLKVGLTNTSAVKNFLKLEEGRAMTNKILERIPMGRMAEPEEMAHTIAYLLSDRSSYITGQCFGSDGGYEIY